MAYWLFKTEPDTYSIDTLAGERTGAWDGVRNFQARNRLRDEVKFGDLVLIYHSSCAQPAVVGLARVTGEAVADPSQFDETSDGFDAKARLDKPRWYQVELTFVEKFPQPLTLKTIRNTPSFSDMELINRSRLSIQAVSKQHFMAICQQCGARLHQ